MRNSALHSFVPLPRPIKLYVYKLQNSIYAIRCFMAAIRGLGSAHPCPVCLISSEDLSDLSKKAPRRTPIAMKNIYNEARKLNTKKAREEVLKEYGLRDVEVRIGLFLTLMAVLTISACRTHSGRLSTQTFMLPFHGIGFTRTTGDYSLTIYGTSSKRL